MSKEIFPAPPGSNDEILVHKIQLLKKELEGIQSEIRAFETVLRTHLSDMIVEAQELFVLYKAIKKAKMEKRLEQKKRGKNYKEPQGLKVVKTEPQIVQSSDEQKEKKRLYREAMLHVHPDKFHMSEEETDVATEVTRRLIEIYQSESLETLKAYHAYIFKGNIAIALSTKVSQIQVDSKVDYLEQEKEKLEKEIAAVKNQHLYKVIAEYNDPLSFVVELKEYYKDRIFKLRKRTRKGL